MDKNKAIFFPYSYKYYDLYKYEYMISDYYIDTWITTNNNLKSLNNIINISLINDIDSFLKEKQFNTLILANDNNIDFDRIIIPFIKKCVKNKIDVFCLTGFNNKQINEIDKICIENDVNFIKIKKQNFKDLNLSEDDIGVSILPLETPVVFVSGLLENTCKFSVQLALRNYFIKNGYKVSQIGTKDYCELFNFNSIPHFMFEDIKEHLKIVLFNFLCKNIEDKEHPDIFIIGIPGGITKYNNTLTNNFGITAFEISNAVYPDAVVFTLDTENYTKNFFENINNIAYRKLGNEINCFVLSDKKLDINESLDKSDFSFITVDEKFIDARLSELSKFESKPIFNYKKENDLNEMSKFIEDSLSKSNVRVL